MYGDDEGEQEGMMSDGNSAVCPSRGGWSYGGWP